MNNIFIGIVCLCLLGIVWNLPWLAIVLGGGLAFWGGYMLKNPAGFGSGKLADSIIGIVVSACGWSMVVIAGLRLVFR